MPRFAVSRRRLLVGGAFVAAAPALAQPSAPKLAALSMIGQRMTIVTYAPSVGSSIDRSERQTIELDGELDRAALGAIDAAVRRARPDVALIPLARPRTKPGAPPQGDDRPDEPALAREVAAMLRDEGVRHLLLVTPHRAAASIEVGGSRISGGSTRLEGVGFYVDPVFRRRWEDSAGNAEGLFAPYAYLRIALIDLERNSAIAESVVTASDAVLPSAGDPAGNPWNSMSSAQKMERLVRLVLAEIERATPQVLAALRPAR